MERQLTSAYSASKCPGSRKMKLGFSCFPAQFLFIHCCECQKMDGRGGAWIHPPLVFPLNPNPSATGHTRKHRQTNRQIDTPSLLGISTRRGTLSQDIPKDLFQLQGSYVRRKAMGESPALSAQIQIPELIFIPCLFSAFLPNYLRWGGEAQIIHFLKIHYI